MTPSRNQSEAIARAQAGDPAAMEEMVRDNIALVKYLVRRFTGAGREMEDLYQLGCLGLVKAIRRFDPTYAVQFSTYAVPVILGEIRRFLRDDGTLRVSRSIQENARRIEAYTQEKRSRTNASTTVEELAEALALNREQVLLALGAQKPVRSFEERIGADGECTLGDTIGYEETDAIDTRLEAEQFLALLDKRERAILMRRYYDRHTQSEVAREFGMTQVQVSRLENKLLGRMRAAAARECEVT